MKSATPYLLAAIGLAVFLGIWELMPALGLVKPLFLPPPSALPAAFMKEVANGHWFEAMRQSLGHYTLGLFCGAALGIAMGVLTGLSLIHI